MALFRSGCHEGETPEDESAPQLPVVLKDGAEVAHWPCVPSLGYSSSYFTATGLRNHALTYHTDVTEGSKKLRRRKLLTNNTE